MPTLFFVCSLEWGQLGIFSKNEGKGSNGIATAFDNSQESPRQTKPKKGPKRKVHEIFVHFCANSGVFFLRKTSTIHIALLFRNAPAKSSWTDLSLVWFARATPEIDVSLEVLRLYNPHSLTLKWLIAVNSDGPCLARGNRISCDSCDGMPKQGFAIMREIRWTWWSTSDYSWQDKLIPRFCRADLGFGFGKRGLLEKGPFQKSPFSRDSREFRDSRDSREPPDREKQRRIRPSSRDSREFRDFRDSRDSSGEKTPFVMTPFSGPEGWILLFWPGEF